MVVHAGVQAGLAVLAKGVGGHRDDRQAQAGAGADLASGGQAVQLGHLHVHQHQGVVAGQRQLHRVAAVVSGLHHQPDAAQQLLPHLLVDRVVLGQQHTLAGMVLAQHGLGLAQRQCCGQRQAGLLAQQT